MSEKESLLKVLYDALIGKADPAFFSLSAEQQNYETFLCGFRIGRELNDHRKETA